MGDNCVELVAVEASYMNIFGGADCDLCYGVTGDFR